MTRFTPDEDDFIRAHYLTVPDKRISRMLGRAEGTVRQRRILLGLIVPLEIVEQRKQDSRIKPGNVPANKGRKLTDYCPPESIERMRTTQFRKGQLPHNTRTDHEISTRADKRGVEYRYIRIGLGKWVPLLRYNYEQANGPVPKGFNLVHKDGDPLNDDAANGLLLSNADLMRKNTYHNYGPEIARVIQLRGALTRQINKAIKKAAHEK